MAEEKTKLSYDWNKLELAQVAAKYLREGEQGTPYVQKAIEMTLKDIGLSDSWVINTITDPRVLQLTVQNQLQTYFGYKQSQTVGDFAKYNSKTLEGYLGENKSKFDLDLKSFETKKYGDFKREKEKLTRVVEDYENYKEGSEEEYNKAKKKLEEHSKMFLLGIAERKYEDNLNKRVEDAVIKDMVKAKYSSKEDKEKKE